MTFISVLIGIIINFQEYSRFLLTRLLETLGAPQSGECNKKTKLRTLTHHLLCQLGHKPCIAETKEKYARWMQSDDPNEGNP